jgi:hypothetical protein
MPINPLDLHVFLNKFVTVSTKFMAHFHGVSLYECPLIIRSNEWKTLHFTQAHVPNLRQISSCSIFEDRILLVLKHLLKVLVPHHSEEHSQEDRGQTTDQGCETHLLVEGKSVFGVESELVAIFDFCF